MGQTLRWDIQRGSFCWEIATGIFPLGYSHPSPSCATHVLFPTQSSLCCLITVDAYCLRGRSRNGGSEAARADAVMSALLKAADAAQLPQRRLVQPTNRRPATADANKRKERQRAAKADAAELKQLYPTVPPPIPTCRVPRLDLVAQD